MEMTIIVKLCQEERNRTLSYGCIPLQKSARLILKLLYQPHDLKWLYSFLLTLK